MRLLHCCDKGLTDTVLLILIISKSRRPITDTWGRYSVAVNFKSFVPKFIEINEQQHMLSLNQHMCMGMFLDNMKYLKNTFFEKVHEVFSASKETVSGAGCVK